MRTIESSEIVDTVAKMCGEANFIYGEKELSTIKKFLDEEPSPSGKEVLNQILENARIAKEESMPMCQDTGFAVLFVELGEDVQISDGSLTDALNEGVRKGYNEHYLRKSIVRNPITRENTGDNTPAVIHYDIVPGDKLKITLAPKGGGSENMSRVVMLKPADGIEGVKEYVINRVKESGPNPCPPIVVGVGVGGTFEKAAMIAKKALIRPLGEPNPDPEIAAVEKDLLETINKLGIGPAGLGGRTTALAVHVEMHPCHIASLPLAVNINCHATRHASATV